MDLKSAFALYLKEKRILENKAPRTIESYDNTFKRYQTLLGELSDWYREEKNALADGARKRVEVLWMNFKPNNLLIN
jgi:hypothetical protein